MNQKEQGESETLNDPLPRLTNLEKEHEELKKHNPFKPVPWYHKLHHRPALLIRNTCLFLTGMTAWYFLFNTSSENSSLPPGVPTGGTIGTALQTNATLPLEGLEPALTHYVNTTVGPIVNSTVSSVVNATKIAGTLATTVLPTAGLIAALRSNSSNVGYNTHHQSATQRFMPSDSHTPNMESKGSLEPYNAKPNILTKESIDDILALTHYVNTTVGPIINSTVSSSTVSSVVNTTKISGTLATTVLPTAGLIAALRSNSSNVGYNTHHQNATQRFMPSDSHTPNMESKGSLEPYNAKPNILTKESIDDITANNFSLGTMQYWIKKDPSIVNARHPNSQTLLMNTARKDEFDVVKYLIENGADLNLPDRDQNTAIRYVDGRMPNAKRIYDYLLEHGADPCVKNVDNRRLYNVTDIASFGTPKLLEALKNCPK